MGHCLSIQRILNQTQTSSSPSPLSLPTPSNYRSFHYSSSSPPPSPTTTEVAAEEDAAPMDIDSQTVSVPSSSSASALSTAAAAMDVESNANAIAGSSTQTRSNPSASAAADAAAAVAVVADVLASQSTTVIGLPFRPNATPTFRRRPRYLDHQHTKKIMNGVNIHRGTVNLVRDENHHTCHLVSFTFDANVDGIITIFYIVKEGPNKPKYPEQFRPKIIPFHKGSGQKFLQPSGTGADLLGTRQRDLFATPFESAKLDTLALVISAEPRELFLAAESGNPYQRTKQITLATLDISLDSDHEACFNVRVIKQWLWSEGIRYELRDIYGLEDASSQCVVCLSDPNDTLVLPCRHFCLCKGCANKLNSDMINHPNCPICRTKVTNFIQIKFESEPTMPED